MTKNEIRNKIYSLNSDSEILNFIKSRIEELEKDAAQVTVGQGYTEYFNDYISSKTRYITGQTKFGTDFPHLKFDDIKPYFDLVKELASEKSCDNELFLFSPLMTNIFDYLSGPDNRKNIDETNRKRLTLYQSALRNGEESISISKISELKCGFCGENSGLAHNIFKILGIDSQVLIGCRNGELHAFNLVFPRGYENQPAVLFDASNMIEFEIGNGKKYSLAYFKVLSGDDYGNLIAGKPVKLDFQGSANLLQKYYPSHLSNLNANFENAVYCLDTGIKLKPQPTPIDMKYS